MSNFVLFIFVLFILAAILRVDFFFTILYLFVGVYILSRLWTNQMVKQLVSSRHFENRAFLGDEITVTITVKNEGWLPIPWLMVHETYPLNLSLTPFFREVISLGGRSAHTFTYRLLARRRGYYQIGPLIVQAGDLLGLNQKQVGRIEVDQLIIYPKIKTMRELGLPTHSPQVILPTPMPIFEDPARILGVRDYYWGDNPRHIHWLATASSGQMMIKQFQPAIARDSAIFLNLTRADYDRVEQELAIELAIVVAASLAHHIITYEKLPVGLDTVAMDPLTKGEQHFSLPPRKERAQLLQILEILARVQAVDKAQFLEHVRQQVIQLTWGATVIIITNQESEPLLHTLLWLKRTGFNPTLVFVRPAKAHQLTAQLEIPTFEVWGEKDIERWSPNR